MRNATPYDALLKRKALWEKRSEEALSKQEKLVAANQLLVIAAQMERLDAVSSDSTYDSPERGEGVK